MKHNFYYRTFPRPASDGRRLPGPVIRFREGGSTPMATPEQLLDRLGSGKYRRLGLTEAQILDALGLGRCGRLIRPGREAESPGPGSLCKRPSPARPPEGKARRG